MLTFRSTFGPNVLGLVSIRLEPGPARETLKSGARKGLLRSDRDRSGTPGVERERAPKSIIPNPSPP
jgi:hypothetical protein